MNNGNLVMVDHYINTLERKIEKTLERKFEAFTGDAETIRNERTLRILSHLACLTTKAEKKSEEAEEKAYLSIQIKQMLFHILYPNGRISLPSVLKEKEYCEVTMSVYADKDDINPIGAYTYMFIYDSIYSSQNISQSERYKQSVEMATGSALTRALNRAGIGLEFFADLGMENFEEENRFKCEQDNQKKAEELEQEKKNQSDILKHSLSSLTFNEPAKAEPQTQIDAQAEPQVTVEPQAEPKKTRKSKTTKEVKATKVAEATLVENNDNQLGFEMKTEEIPKMTLEEAYEMKGDYAVTDGITLRQLVETGEERRIALLYKKTKNEDLKKAILLVCKDISSKDKEFEEFCRIKNVDFGGI